MKCTIISLELFLKVTAHPLHKGWEKLKDPFRYIFGPFGCLLCCCDWLLKHWSLVFNKLSQCLYMARKLSPSLRRGFIRRVCYGNPIGNGRKRQDIQCILPSTETPLSLFGGEISLSIFGILNDKRSNFKKILFMV